MGEGGPRRKDDADAEVISTGGACSTSLRPTPYRNSWSPRGNLDNLALIGEHSEHSLFRFAGCRP